MGRAEARDISLLEVSLTLALTPTHAERIDNFFLQMADATAIPKLLDGTLLPEILEPDAQCPSLQQLRLPRRRSSSITWEMSWSHTTNGPE